MSSALLPIYDRDITLVKGKGSRLWDKDGREWLDFAAGIAVNGFGYGDRKIVAAIKKQAETLIHASNLYHNEPASALAERLVRLAFPSKVFFTNSGTEAWEGAMKFARRIGKEQGRIEYVVFEHSFHGRSMGALSTTWTAKYREPFEPLVPGVRFVPRNDLAAVAAAVGDKTAAVMIEPVQGEGGIRPATPEFLKGLAALCRERGALLVFDEIQCGLGRTGKMFAFQHSGVVPDMLTLAKPLAGGLPMGAILLRESLAGALKVGDHGTTFGGNPVCAAAALAVLDHLEAPGFLDDIAARGLYLVRGLKRLARKHKGAIAEIRGLGLMIGVEFRGEAAPVLKGLREKGILAAKAGDKVLRLLPPLVVKRGEIRQLLAALDEVLAAGAGSGAEVLKRSVAGRVSGFEIRPHGGERTTMGNVKKVVLAYSGGLDTSIIIPWLKEHYGGAEVVAFCGDVGQGDDFEAVKKKALRTGASKCIVKDLREEFVRDYCYKALSAGAVYEDRYLLGTALARPLLAYHQVQVAIKEGADALAHGATGKGNDQVRFEVTYGAFAPHMRVIAPWREWTIRSREDALAYARKHGVPVDQTKKDLFSRDGNLWHLSHEGGNLEDVWDAPQKGMFKLTVDPLDAPARPRLITLGFERGVPVSLDGKRLKPVQMVETLNRVAGAHGVGRLDLVENRLVGIKSRGVYETPAGTVLHIAHRELERLVLDRDTLHFKQAVSVRYAQLIYDGLWFSTLREALAGFVDETEREVTGEVRIRLYKGTAEPVGRRSPRSLYRQDLATFGQGMAYDHKDAEGFIRLFGLPERVRALTRARVPVDVRAVEVTRPVQRPAKPRRPR